MNKWLSVILCMSTSTSLFANESMNNIEAASRFQYQADQSIDIEAEKLQKEMTIVKNKQKPTPLSYKFPKAKAFQTPPTKSPSVDFGRQNLTNSLENAIEKDLQQENNVSKPNSMFPSQNS